ncbi:MAG TPA: transglycosylase SLT domain-containing protein [Tenuifilaceae bacterium]|nr:transglycosylase SLT domain-containing protein [Tenuifilaceae bacterium]HPI45808.1 transglycosylase SLT domain-containing protein [Tenuifilaceae bacterium]
MGFKVKIGLTFTFLFCQLLTFAGGVKGERKISDNCPIVEMVDELAFLRIFPKVDANPRALDTIGKAQDLMYEYHIAAIGKQSPIDYDYNQYVRRYIDIYTIERREQVSQMLGLAEMYFPLFDEYLDKYQLPLELKYLAVVESALNPMAVSKTGAVGLWQFKINTAKMFNLNVSSYVDERMDPVKSTEAACLYLQYLYRTFNNWQLALAAYNVGPGAVKNAIARSGGEKNFWKIYPNLPEAAQNYVPAFIAATYVMKNYTSHSMSPAKPLISYPETDTVMVVKAVNLNVLAKSIDVPIEIIRFLNPTFKLDYIPSGSSQVTLRLPSGKTSNFIQNEGFIYENSSKPKVEELKEFSDSTSSKQKVVHTVKSGDSMHKIAIIYGCTIEDIQNWNPKIDSVLSVGQGITLWVTQKQLGKLNQQN